MPRGFLQCTPVYILKPFFHLHLARVIGVSKGGIASVAGGLGTGGKEREGNLGLLGKVQLSTNGTEAFADCWSSCPWGLR